MAMIKKPNLSDFRSRLRSWYDLDRSDTSRITSLEGLRGLAVFLVFFVHCDSLFSYLLPSGSALRGFVGFLGTAGNSGVDLFFLLSGYLIYGALVRGSTSYAKFLQRRIDRLYPTFTAVFVLYLLFSVVLPTQNKIHGSVSESAAFVIANFLLLPGIFHITPIIVVAWSLSYEMCYYTLMPATLIALRVRLWRPVSRIYFWLAFWVIFLAVHAIFPSLPGRMAIFILGMALSDMAAAGWTKRRLPAVGAVLSVLAFLAALLLAGWGGRLAWATALHVPVSPVTLGLASFSLVLYAAEQPGFLNHVFSSAPLRALGNVSYSYYLIHGLTLKAMWWLLQETPQTSGTIVFATLCVVGFALSFVTSTILFLAVERPFSYENGKFHPHRFSRSSGR